LASHVKNVIKAVVADPLIKLKDIEVMSEEERQQVVYAFNDTAGDYPQDKTIHRLFEEQAEKSGDSVAVIGAAQLQITYNELNEKSNRLARLLRKKGIRPNTIAALMVERSLEMMVGLYAILKAGAAYLPVEPDYPGERIRYMLEDSGTRFLLTREKYAGNINLDIDAEILHLEDETLYREEPGNPERISTPGDLFYMIYTSGSTGKPKGVMVKIRGFVNLLYWYVTEFELNARDCVLLIAPISFDLAQKNLFASLIRGGILCLASPGLPDYHELSGTIARQQVTIINSAPSVFYPLVEFNSPDHFIKLKSLRYVFLGGEPIHGDKLKPWLYSEICRCELVNTYGPTECTDIGSSYRVSKNDIKEQRNIPIGKPIYNVKIFIINNDRQVQPIGVIGELCIGGVGLSKGYHKNPELTMAKFIKTPYLPEKEVYRTGDLARWLADGNIEFSGRIDYQVKIRGFRIELGEIESRLHGHEKVKEAVVTARNINEERGYPGEAVEKYLCAYVVLEEEIDISELRVYLGKRLADCMIPSYFVRLEKIPLTPSGKVDRKKLPKPEIIPGEFYKYTAPRTDVEKNLVEIWGQVLGMEKDVIGIDSNFCTR
jgi:amino acid adenylation domain-containing protein